MPKNKLIRFIFFALAIWLILSISIALVSYLYRGWQQLQQPTTSSIISGMKSPQESERRAALEKIKYPLWLEPDIIQAVSDMALNESNPDLQAKAIGLSATGYTQYNYSTAKKHGKPTRKTIFPQEKIEHIASLVLEEKTGSNLGTDKSPIYGPLYRFLQNTINAQSDPYLYVQHLTRILEGVLATEDNFRKLAKVLDILHTLKAYAASMTLPDNTLQLLVTIYNNKANRNKQAATVVIEIFYNLASKQEFGDDIQHIIETAAVEHQNKALRLTAIVALEQQSRLTGQLSPALKDAVKDKNPWNASVASQAISKFIEAQGKKTASNKDELLATAFDRSQHGKIRASALLQGITLKDGKTTIKPGFFDAAEALRNDPEPAVRVASIIYIRYMHSNALYQQHHEKLLARLESALRDDSAAVRTAAINMVEYFPTSNDQRSKYILTGLMDTDSAVLIAAMRIVSIKKLNTPLIIENLAKLANHENTAVSSYATRYHKRLVNENRSFLETVTTAFTDRESQGGLFYLVDALLALLLAAGFGIYYAYAMIKHYACSHKKAALTFVVLLIWTGATILLVGTFIASLFGMGHNTPAPPSEQIHISLRLLGLVAAYGVLGLILSLFVRILPKGNIVKTTVL